MQGQAADISLRGSSLGQLHRAALSLRGGGVGYYPAHGFVHVDVGPIRTWGGGEPSYVASSSPAPTSHVVVARGGQHPTSKTISLKPGAFLTN
jgi:hypothetical protein